MSPMGSLRFRKREHRGAVNAPGGTGSGKARFRPLAGKMPAMLDEASLNGTMKLSTRS